MATCTSTVLAVSSGSYTPADAILSNIALGGNTDARCSLNLGAGGTTADLVNLVHRKTYPLAATPTAINLYDGSLLDPQGNACPFRRIRRLRVKVLDTTDGHTVKLGYATTTANAWTALVTNPGQITLQAATATNNAWAEFVAPNTTGWVVASNNYLLQFDPGSSTIQIIVEIDGANA